MKNGYWYSNVLEVKKNKLNNSSKWFTVGKN